MAIVIKTIRGRRYRYLQHSYREGGRVRTTSTYLGPVDGTPQRKRIFGRTGEFTAINFQHEFILTEELLLRGKKERDAEEARKRSKEQQKLAELYAKYGLRLGPRNPVPIEKPTPHSTAPAMVGPTIAPPEVPPDTAAVTTGAPDAKGGKANT